MQQRWRKLALKYYEKSRILRKEALIDFEHGAYNKCVSATYFMVEALANALFALKKQKTVGFQGRANLIKQLVGFDEYISFLKLHERREKADHREELMDRDTAKQVLDMGLSLYNKIEKRFKNLLNEGSVS